MNERREIFDSTRLKMDSNWTLDYGVPFDSITYFHDSTYVEDWNMVGDDCIGHIRAMDRVEKLLQTTGSASFIVRRPIRGTGDYEYAVFMADLPRRRR